MPPPFGISNPRITGKNSNHTDAKSKMPDLRPTQDNHRQISWPPTQVRLRPTMGPDDDDSDVPILEREQDYGLYMDEDPLTYFLTPAPALDTDGDLAMMDFDAGIDPEVDDVRSVSPSSLDGGSIRGSGSSSSGRRFASGPFRPPTPPRSPPAHPLVSDSTTDEEEDDDDNEDYIRLGPNHGLPPPPFTLRDFAALKSHRAESGLLSPSSPTSPPPASLSSSPRGRSSSRFGPGRGATGAGVVVAPRRRLSPRSWRHPSPDVWSIEEEPEREAVEARDDKAAADAAADAAAAAADSGKQARAVDAAAAAKPKKKVRFVLPVKE